MLPTSRHRSRLLRPGRRGQRGLSLLALLLFGVVAVMVVVVGMRVLPSALEFMAIKRNINKVATSGVSTPQDAQRAFDRMSAIDDISSISGKDLVVTRGPNGSLVISFSYEKRVPLFGPASLLIDYEGSTASR